MAAKKVADLLVDVFAEAGVRLIYGISGDSLNGVTDSMRRRPTFDRKTSARAIICVRGK